ncbi:MAG: hypothetical protein ACKOWC_08300 [Limnohabitans sp.]
MSELESIRDALKRLEQQATKDSDRSMTAFKALLSSIESSLADVVEAMTRDDDESPMLALAEAIKGLKLQAPEVTVNPQITVQPAAVSVAAPAVKVEVNPTPITVEAVMPQQPAPVIHMMPAQEQGACEWEIRVPGAYHGVPDRVLTITKRVK